MWQNVHRCRNQHKSLLTWIALMRNIGQFSRHASQTWMARQTLGYSDRCPLYSRKRTSLKWAARSLIAQSLIVSHGWFME